MDARATHLTESAEADLIVTRSLMSPSLLSSIKRNLQDAEQQTKPPLRIKKQKLPEVNKRGFPSDCNPAILSGRRAVRPNMLSRVITVKKCNRQTNLRLQSADRVRLETAVCHKENVENSPIVVDGAFIDPSSPDDAVKLIRIHQTSPLSTLAHLNCHIDQRTCHTSIEDTPQFGKNRFVSPNTASVASALSLLSRLPFLHR